MAETHGLTNLLDAARAGDAAAASRLWETVYQELHCMARAHMAREAGVRTLQPTALVNECYLRLFGQVGPSAAGSTTGDVSSLSPLADGRGSDRTGDNGTEAHAPHFDNRRHFFAAAAEAMRRILVEGARRRGRKKRGEGDEPLHLTGDVPDTNSAYDDGELLAVHEVLERLASAYPREAEVVKQRYFIGLSVEETSAVMGIATRTVEKDWAFARAWLKRALASE